MILESALNPLAKTEVDESNMAARVSLRGHEFKGVAGAHIGGHYRTVMSTGALTVIAAGAPLVSARWTNADRSMLVNRIRAWATIGTAFGTAQELSIDLARVTNFITADSAGTQIDLGEACRKDRSSMRASQLTNLRVAAAVALTLGTGTEETPSAGTAFGGLLNVVGSMSMQTLYDHEAGHEHPFTLNNAEGFRIRNRVLMGAAGVVVMTFEIDWTEIPSALAAQ